MFSKPSPLLTNPPSASIRRQLFAVILLAFGVISLGTITLTARNELPMATAVRARAMGMDVWNEKVMGFWSPPVEDRVCDATATNGYVHPITSHWHSVDPECPSRDIATALQQTPRDELWSAFPSFRNKSVLILGDSVARHLLESMCKIVGGEEESRFAKGWEVPYADGVICTVPELGMKIVNFHIYGFANSTDPETVEILSKAYPGNTFAFEDRLPRLFDEIVPDFTPDYIQVSGGAWDFLYMYTKDVLGKQYNEDVPPSELKIFGDRLRQLFAYLGTTFPEAKLTFMHMALVFPSDLGQKVGWGNKHMGLPIEHVLPEAEYPPLYSVRRQAQHMAHMRQVVESEGIDSVDYAKVQHTLSDEIFYTPKENVHPYYVPRHVMSGMILQKLQRFVEYGQ